MFDEHVDLGGDEDEEDENLLLKSCVGSCCRNWRRWLLARLPPEMFSPSTPKSKKEGQGGRNMLRFGGVFVLKFCS